MHGLSNDAARRMALAAQGFADPSPKGRIDGRHVRKIVDRLGVVQLDSVNVVARSHELPLFSRLGGHRWGLLHDHAYDRQGLWEYWGHEASLLPFDLYPLLRWRMERAKRGHTWAGVARLAEQRPGFVEEVFEQVAEHGELTASQLREPGMRSGPWWGWNEGKIALEWLFWTGRITARRKPNFERVYLLPERVIPKIWLDAPAPAERDAIKELLVRAARALGVATVSDLADYWRVKPTVARPLVQELVEEGVLRSVSVEGWRQPAVVDPAARLPRTVTATTLLSPFDSLVWYRERTERLFGFHYRLEIFTPAPKRVYGYYVLPFLHHGRLAGRVDLKSDRAASTLRALGTFAEAGVDTAETAAALAGALRELADYLGLETVSAEGRGDLAPVLRRALRTRSTR